MSDIPFDDELGEDEQAQLAAFLGEAAVWEEPSMEDEDAIVAAILAEASPVVTPAPVPAASELPSNVIPISRSRNWLGSIGAGIAAGLLVIAGFAFVSRDGDPEGVVLALVATDVAPNASAEAIVAPLRSGTRIILDVSGLPPAEPGTYYEAWMRKDAEVGVSAGTFHLRGGDGIIELWAGVTPDDYPLITVTLQDEAQTESSGVVVLRGLLDANDFED